MRTTLVLNKDWSPISVFPFSAITWKEAIHQIFLNHVEVVANYEQWTISSPSVSIRVPSVVVIRRPFVKPRSRRPTRAEMVFVRDEYTCQYCGVKNSKMTKDHILPVSLGGSKHSMLNLVTACYECNNKKGNDITIVPRVMPIIPTYTELLSKLRKRPIIIPHSSWIPYIGWSDHLVKVVEPIGMPGYKTKMN